MNRRNFIRYSSIATSGLVIGTQLSAFTGSPNEKVIVGAVGTNSRGFYLAKMFAQLPGVELGYVCDVDENVVTKTIAEIEKITGKKPKACRDVRKLLEEKDLDAIFIAAPDHWH